jgi:hypothetical protein
MTPDGWIQIAVDVAVLGALVFAMLMALVVPHSPPSRYPGEDKISPSAIERLIGWRVIGKRDPALRTQAKTLSSPDSTELR